MTINYYCDESCHLENDHVRPYMILAYIACFDAARRKHTKSIKQLKEKHNFFAEIKWTSVSNSKIDFYLDLVDYFFQSDLNFRALKVDKRDVDLEKYAGNYDDFYYKMYYFLINHKLDMGNKYNIYLDIKDTLSARKADKLKLILNTKYGVINNLQNMHSKESTLMQLSDFLLGAISYENNDNLKVNQTKVAVINKIKELSGANLISTNYSDKFNILFFKLNK